MNLISKCVSEVSRKEVKLSKKIASQKKLENLTYSSVKSLESIEKLTSQKDIENVLSLIDSLLEFLPGPLTIQKLVNVDEICCAYYAENYYIVFIEKIINLFDNNFPFRIDQLYEPVKNLFSVEDCSIFRVNFEYLLKHLRTDRKNIAEIIVSLLQISLQCEGFFACVFYHICNIDVNNDFLEEERFTEFDTFLKALISLPNRVANALEGSVPNFFIPKNFSSFLIYNLLKLIEFISELIKLEPKYESCISFQKVSLIFSKIIVNFNERLSSEALIVFTEIAAILTNKLSNKVNLYRKIFQSIFSYFDRPAVEIAAKLFLLNINPEKYTITEIWGKNLINNENWKFSLCTKIPLLIYFEKEYNNLVINLVVYLSRASEFHLINLLIDLLTIWADRSSINHTSVEQRIFISKIIIYVINSLQNIGLSDTERAKIQNLIFSGMSAHLESSVELIRSSGMKTGEIIINFLNQEYENKAEMELKFDYDSLKEESKIVITELQNIIDKDMQNYFKQKHNFDTTVEELITKLVLMEDRDFKYIPPERKFRNRQILELNNEVVLSEPFKPKNSSIKIIDSVDFELDSDDDLEPYDLSNDTKVSKKSPPAYLRDLRDGLLETEDHEVFALSLENSENLIISQLPDDDSAIGLEILEILISLEPRFYVDNFDGLVFQTCVAITCVYPVVYAEYLCRQIHADLGTYSIARRVFMLDVLRRAAETLSNLKPDKPLDNVTKRIKKLSSAEEVIRKRLESKTRYFKKHTYFKLEKPNKFAEVAGYFFFPLLYGFNQNKMLCQSAKEDSDYILLTHFIETLAVLMWAAKNCPVAPRMAKEIFHFSWYLRFHEDVRIRMGILSLISSAILNIPQSILLQDFINELLEVRLWLGDLLNPAKGEPNSECRNLATCAMVLIEGVLKVDVDEN